MINLILTRTFFLIAWSQIFKNYAILINHGSYQVQQFVCKNLVLEHRFLVLLAIKEFIFNKWKRSSFRKSFP